MRGYIVVITTTIGCGKWTLATFHCGRALVARLDLRYKRFATQTWVPKLLSHCTPNIIILPTVIFTNVASQREFWACL
jgi:hypothetical protein